MVSNLFLLSFVYLILKTFIKNSYTVKNFLLIGLVLGLSLSSFYYYFVLESLVLISIIILKYKFNFVKNILFRFKYYLYLISSFLITSLPFLINLYFHEKDFTNRQCVYNLTLENKEILLKFYLKQFTEIGFVILFFGVVFSSIWLNIKNNKNKKFISLFCILFISSVLKPFIFYYSI